MLPDTPLVASFETGFHSTIPDYARVYPFPKVYRDKYGLEKYGFHGASHSYAARSGAPPDPATLGIG